MNPVSHHDSCPGASVDICSFFASTQKPINVHEYSLDYTSQETRERVLASGNNCNAHRATMTVSALHDLDTFSQARLADGITGSENSPRLESTFRLATPPSQRHTNRNKHTAE